MQVLEIEDGDILVKFMVSLRSSPDIFTWSGELPSWQRQHEIIGGLSQPQLLPGRGVNFKFDSDELAKYSISQL